jgi:Galactosyltransferase
MVDDSSPLTRVTRVGLGGGPSAGTVADPTAPPPSSRAAAPARLASLASTSPRPAARRRADAAALAPALPAGPATAVVAPVSCARRPPEHGCAQLPKMRRVRASRAVRRQYILVAIASAALTASLVSLRSGLNAATLAVHYNAWDSRPRAKVFVLVKTTPAAVERRTAMRETWLGDVKGHAEVAYRYFSDDPAEDERDALETEARHEGDLVVLDGLRQQAHRQIGAKMVRSFEWIANNWIVGHVVMVDDDTYVNTASLFADYPSWSPDMFYLGLHMDAQPVVTVPANASRVGKYGESHLFPVRTWPRYASGPFYALSRDALEPFIHPSAPLRAMTSSDAMTGAVLMPYNVTCTWSPSQPAAKRRRWPVKCLTEFVCPPSRAPCRAQMPRGRALWRGATRSGSPASIPAVYMQSTLPRRRGCMELPGPRQCASSTATFRGGAASPGSCKARSPSPPQGSAGCALFASTQRGPGLFVGMFQRAARTIAPDGGVGAGGAPILFAFICALQTESRCIRNADGRCALHCDAVDSERR